MRQIGRAATGGIVRTTDHDHLGRVLQGARMEYMPHPGEAFSATLRLLRLPGVTAQHLEIGGCISRGTIEPGLVGLVLPAGRDGPPTTTNGMTLTGRDALLMRGGGEFVASGGAGRSWVSVALPAALVAELGELAPPPLRAGGAAAAMDLPDGPADRLRGALLAAAAMATAPPATLATEDGARSLAAALRELAAEALTAAPARPPSRRATREALRVFREAEDALHANLARPLYRDDLCALLGVSRRKLHDAFMAVAGVTPPAYLKLRRLVLVRRALRAAPDGPPLVKSVALSHGFWHLGHFARDYGALFGELPSATVAAAHAQVTRRELAQSG